jgi:hypothetical protein
MGLVHPPLLPAPAASAHGFGVRALGVRNLGWTQALSAWDFESFEFRVSAFGAQFSGGGSSAKAP